MCTHRNSRMLVLKGGRTINVDGCIRDLIYALRNHGIDTLACCCGLDELTEGVRLEKFLEKINEAKA